MVSWRPRVDYGAASIRYDLPMEPWDLIPVARGGVRWSGAGVPNTWIRLDEHRAVLTLRLWEDEYAKTLQWVRYAQRPPHVFYLWFDQDQITTRFPVYLESPQVGDEVRMEADEVPGVLIFRPTIVTSNRAPLDALQYHGVER